ncbi:MAG: type I glyceraldehyde-3-phosphate dehydrogenase [Flavobacteriales bacterium]|nr:type I glyceraldehyde-3-phosphate dehydrogenase [Flavobacteriales bacterium]
MGKIRVAINGFGRIGRITFRAMIKDNDIEIVAINDLADTRTLAHLLKYDSIHGIFDGTIEKEGTTMIVNGQRIATLSERDPALLPWGEMGIDVVLESTGLFRDEEETKVHLASGARKVILSAPPGNGGIKSVVLGINEDIIDERDTIISNASCTTNCAAPMIKVLDDNWGVDHGFITTIHSYTGDQRLHDAPHQDLRRARAAGQSMIPTSTGAAKAITKIFPHLEGHLGGCGIRVPVPDGSLTDITCTLTNETTEAAINEAFKNAANGELKGILEYTEDPIVSIDIVGNYHSCIFDSLLTSVLGKVVKIVGWYDNESGYSARLVELVKKIG